MSPIPILLLRPAPYTQLYYSCTSAPISCSTTLSQPRLLFDFRQSYTITDIVSRSLDLRPARLAC